MDFVLKYHEAEIPLLMDDDRGAIAILKEELPKVFKLKHLVMLPPKDRNIWDDGPVKMDLLVIVEDEKSEENINKLREVESKAVSKYPESPIKCIFMNEKIWKNKDIFIPRRDSILKDGIDISFGKAPKTSKMDVFSDDDYYVESYEDFGVSEF